jgi:hypothetical protein
MHLQLSQPQPIRRNARECARLTRRTKDCAQPLLYRITKGLNPASLEIAN